MIRDTERRVTRALAAYAELVHPESGHASELDGAAPAPPPSGDTAGRRWRGPLLAAAAVAAVAVITTLVVGHPLRSTTAAGPHISGTRPVASSRPSSTSPATRSSADRSGSPSGPADPSQVQTVPASPKIGVAYPFDLLTHCGIVGANVGGVYFVAEQPLTNGPGGRPAGWDNPYQRGTMTLVSAQEAVFHDAAGHTVRFRAHPNTAGIQPCD